MSSDLYIESEYDPTKDTTKEPWNKVQSSYAAKRKQMQQERMRQLKELEEQVTETANWNQRRKELISTASTSTRYQRKPSIATSEQELTPSSSTSTTASFTSISEKRTSREPSSTTIDLGDATLEDLEGLIAASAKRLASYRLRNQSFTTKGTSSITPVEEPSFVKKKNEEMSKWKELLVDTSSSSTLMNRLSNTKHYNADPINSSTSPRSATEANTGEKSPSASYLRLRNMFEKETSPTKSTTSTLADLASSTSSSLNNKGTYHGSRNNSDILLLPSNTRSTLLSNATPKIGVESPRISSSSTHQPRVSNSSSHLRKATRSYSHQNIMQPPPSAELTSSSSSLLVDHKTGRISSSSTHSIGSGGTNVETSTSTTRSRKLSTLASLQQRQRQNHHLLTNKSVNEEETIKEDNKEREEGGETKTGDDYMNSIKKPSSTAIHSRFRADSTFEQRKIKTSITSNHSTTQQRKVVAVTPKENILKPGINVASTTVVQRRKRGTVRAGVLKKKREREKAERLIR